MSVTRKALFLLALLAVVLRPATAEASRYEMNGLDGEGIIIWDGDFDVSTMQNGCTAGTCGAKLNVPAAVQILLTEFGTFDLRFSSLYLVLSAPVAPADCASYLATDVDCGELDTLYPNYMTDDGNPGSINEVNSRQDNRPNTLNPTQFLVRLKVLLPSLDQDPSIPNVFNGDSFPLTAESLRFLSDHDVSLWHVGFDLQFQQLNFDPDCVAASVETSRSPSSVRPPFRNRLRCCSSEPASPHWRRDCVAADKRRQARRRSARASTRATARRTAARAGDP